MNYFIHIFVLLKIAYTLIIRLINRKKMVKVCIYARVSTKGQDYERQLEELRKYATQMKYDVVCEFSEKSQRCEKGGGAGGAGRVALLR